MLLLLHPNRPAAAPRRRKMAKRALTSAAPQPLKTARTAKNAVARAPSLPRSKTRFVFVSQTVRLAETRGFFVGRRRELWEGLYAPTRIRTQSALEIRAPFSFSI